MIGRRVVLLGAAATAFAVGGRPTRGGPGDMTEAGDVTWSYLADTVMGGVSEGSARITNGALRLTGTVSTENRGGFIQARTELDGFPAEARGLRIRVRGDGQAYFIHLRTSRTRLPWQYYQGRFDAPAEWTDVVLTWEDFAPSGRLLPASPAPADIRSLGLAAYGRDHVVDVALAGFGWI